MIPQSLISKPSRVITSVLHLQEIIVWCYLCQTSRSATACLKHSDQLTDKMSDSDKSCDILRGIKPYSYEPRAKKVTDSINCEELAAASAYVDPDSHLAVLPTPGPNPQQRWIGVYLFVLVEV